MKNENSVKTACKKYLKARGIQHITVTTNGFGSSGWPDICFLYKGVFVGIECKFGKNKPSALQEQKLDYIKAQGGIAMLVNEENVGDVEEVLDYLDCFPALSLSDGAMPDYMWCLKTHRNLKLWRD
jgi:hypothetical protein